MVDLPSIIKKENIIKVDPEMTLSHALAHLSTSHDAAFVFSDEDKFMGVINPYYCLIRSSHPGNAKVEHCLHHPPKVYVDYSLPKVASLLIESKIHYLPVFDNKERFMGIISARRILSNLRNLPSFRKTIGDALRFRKKPLTVIYEDETVAQALALFKSTKLSKLVVINRDMKLKGILSYYDLISFLTQPKNHEGKMERIGNKIHLFNQHVKNYMKTYVLSLKNNNSLSDAFNLVVSKKIGSVVIVDEERHPVGIITTRDLLRFYMEGELMRGVSDTFSKMKKLLLNR
ncbi:MAG: CBS domain-containing protein [Patescibacteria group bacterium]